MYKGKVDKNESLDPNYRVKFSYTDDKYSIPDGEATFTRKSPFPVVTFNDYTDYVIEKLEVDSDTVKNIKLEIGKTVFDFMMNAQ